MGIGLGQDDPGLAGGGVHGQQVQPALVAGLALDVQGLAVLRPVHPGQVDVGVVAQVHLDARAGQRLDVKLDAGVGAAGAGVALRDHIGAGGVYFRTLDDVDAGLVDEGDGDGAIIGAPPVAGGPAHFLLGDELGGPPALQLDAALGERALRAAGDGHQIEVVVADPGDETALGRDLGVDLVAGAGGQLAGLSDGHVIEPQVALDGRQDHLAQTVPGIVHDATGGDAGPLAPRLFGLRKLAFGRRQLLAVQQQARFTARHVGDPQVGDGQVIGAGLDVGDRPAVGRQFDPPGAGTGDVGALEDALCGKLFGHGGGCGEQGRKRGGGEFHERCSTGSKPRWQSPRRLIVAAP